MSFESDFDELLAEEVVRRPYTGQDKYGAPSFGTSERVQARVVRTPEILRRVGSGEATGTIREVLSSAKVYCSGVIGWGLRDRITLPDGTEPPILEVRTYPDEDGPHHQVVLV